MNALSAQSSSNPPQFGPSPNMELPAIMPAAKPHPERAKRDAEAETKKSFRISES